MILSKDDLLKLCIEALKLEDQWRETEGLTSDRIRIKAGSKRREALDAWEQLTEPETHDHGKY